MSHKPIAEADIEALATGRSYERGYDYYHSGAIYEVVRRGNELTAEVEGSQYDPYTVRVTLDESGIVDTDCTCPYDWGGICKHIVAVLLHYVHETDDITDKPPLALLLADLSADQLRQLIERTAESMPDLVGVIERELTWLGSETAVSTSPNPSIPIVDLTSIYREIAKDFRLAARSGRYEYDYFYDDDDDLFDPNAIIEPHLDQARALLEAGRIEQAEAVATAVMDAYEDGLSELDEWVYEYNADVIHEAALEIAVVLAEVLLSGTLSETDYDEWEEQIMEWEGAFGDMTILMNALEEGWDDRTLVAAMQGDLEAYSRWQDPEEIMYYAEELSRVRLRILARQERYTEYLNLAQATGHYTYYVTMLVQTGQVDKAITEAKNLLTLPTQILHLAQQIASQNSIEQAIDLAAHGLTLSVTDNMAGLAEWTCQQAQAQGDHALALRAAETAFRHNITLSNYQQVEKIAGTEWTTVKARLLQHTATSSSWNTAGLVDVYLFEGMLNEAMATIDKQPSFYLSDVTEKVIAATRDQYPDWGIGVYKRLAERIMDEGKAKYYHTAASHLKKAHDIYAQHGRLTEWSAYLSDVLDKHGRKYKLVPLLRDIR